MNIRPIYLALALGVAALIGAVAATLIASNAANAKKKDLA